MDASPTQLGVSVQRSGFRRGGRLESVICTLHSLTEPESNSKTPNGSSVPRQRSLPVGDRKAFFGLLLPAVAGNNVSEPHPPTRQSNHI
jgi:hypothetical protein